MPASNTPPPKVASAATGFGAIVADVSESAATLGAIANDRLMAPWRAFALATGKTGPGNVSRAGQTRCKASCLTTS